MNLGEMRADVRERIGERTCTRCLEVKSLDEFYGKGACKLCRKKEYESQRMYKLDEDIRRRYGLSPEARAAMEVEQNGVCAICKQPETCQRNGRTKRLAVDHDHETDEVRGLLCSNCNRGLGLYEDDPERLIAAAAYLLERE